MTTNNQQNLTYLILEHIRAVTIGFRHSSNAVPSAYQRRTNGMNQ